MVDPEAGQELLYSGRYLEGLLHVESELCRATHVPLLTCRQRRGRHGGVGVSNGDTSRLSELSWILGNLLLLVAAMLGGYFCYHSEIMCCLSVSVVEVTRFLKDSTAWRTHRISTPKWDLNC